MVPLFVLLLGVAVILVGFFMRYRFHNDENCTFYLFGGLLITITITIWGALYFNSIKEHAKVNVFVGSCIAYEYADFIDGDNPQSVLVELNEISESIPDWFREVQKANSIIELDNYYNSSFWLDYFVADWDSPPIISFQCP